MTNRQASENWYVKWHQVLSQQAQYGQRSTGLKIRELSERYAGYTVEMPALSQHRQLPVNN